MESKRVVVTGLGAITPIGNTVKEFWEGLVNGKNGACEITRFDSTLYTRPSPTQASRPKTPTSMTWVSS